MKPDGEYYLANDITVYATWNNGKTLNASYKSNTAFCGVLDGRGYTVKTTVPLFANLQGTVMNLTIEGKIAALTIGTKLLHTAGLAMWTCGELYVENVTNKATILGGTACAGILGYGAAGTNATFISCHNYGDIDSKAWVGGIVGYIEDDQVTIEACANYGDLTTKDYGAGIIARFGRNEADMKSGSLITISDCVNEGNVTCAKGQTGGILGYLIGGAVIRDCVNRGEIVNAAGCAGGIFGASQNTENICMLEIEGCTNYGKVSGIGTVGGIVARTCSKAPAEGYDYRITDCINHGDLNAVGTGTGKMCIGGIVGDISGNAAAANGVFCCVNNGHISVDSTQCTGAVYPGGIVGFGNSRYIPIKHNISVGTLAHTSNPESTAAQIVTLIAYNKAVKAGDTYNNYALACGDYPAAVVGEISWETAGLVVSAEDLASGAVAYRLNQYAGEVICYQRIGTDAIPSFRPVEGGTVYQTADG